MPKKDGIMKTYSFDKSILDKMNILCENQRRTQTNLIEYLIEKEYNGNNGKRTESNPTSA